MLKDKGYNTGGLNPPKAGNVGVGPGAEACDLAAASTGTLDYNPNVNNVDPGFHHEKGAGKSAK